MSHKVHVLTGDSWDRDVLGAKGPVLVDFWAEWCPPCRQLGPVIEALAEEFSGRTKIGKLNVDEHNALASRYGIRSIPALLLFKDGQVVDQVLGYHSQDDLRRFLSAHVNEASVIAGR